jgi:hypothetical protein
MAAGRTARRLPLCGPARSRRNADARADSGAGRRVQAEELRALAGFAGVYDVLKSCRRLELVDVPLGTMWLMTKWVVWFEGDDLVFVQFLAPGNVVRGKLKFRQDYTSPDRRTVKLYDVVWQGGDTEIVSFLPDREIFGGKFGGKTLTFNYARRCGDEKQILGWPLKSFS